MFPIAHNWSAIHHFHNCYQLNDRQEKWSGDSLEQCKHNLLLWWLSRSTRITDWTSKELPVFYSSEFTTHPCNTYSCNKQLWSIYFVQGAYDTIRQRTPSSMEGMDIQVNNSIKYCSSFTDVLPKGNGDLQFCWDVRKEFPKMIAVVVCLKEWVWFIKGRMQERHYKPRETPCKDTVA